ncbi:MAG TPA: transcriptional regulator [Caulobacterales bacterium]|jgi:DNA-binding MarR family transcriptional regulator|nr:transcriptional regulator [Caulobacterales bacterium]
MSAPNEIIHQSLRLKIMAALDTTSEMLEFKRLKAITEATDGNLGRQLTVLAEAGYIEIAKDFHANRPRTRARITAAGRKALNAHIAYLRKLLTGLKG